MVVDKVRYSVIPTTLCFIFNPQGQVLLIERGSHKFDAGMFNALGGHIEFGEEIISSANREIEEECGVKADSTTFVGVSHITNFFGKDFMLFITRSLMSSDVDMDSDEGKLHWIDQEKLSDYKIYEDILPYLKHMFEFDTTFSAVATFDGKSGLDSVKVVDLG